MKKKSMNRRLNLNKRTITRLNPQDMKASRGGTGATTLVTFTCICEISIPVGMCDTTICTTSIYMRCTLPPD